MGEETPERLEVGAVLNETIAIYRESLLKTLLLAAVFIVPQQALQLILGDSLLSLLTLPISFLAVGWLEGAFVLHVQSSKAQADRPVRELIGAAWPRLLALSLLAFVAGLGIGFGLLLLIIPGVILGLMWFVVFPAMVVEGLGVFDSLSRSSDLTRGCRMQILWIALIIGVFEIVLAGLGFLMANIDPGARAVVVTVTQILFSPFVAMVGAVVYFRLYELKGSKPFEF